MGLWETEAKNQNNLIFYKNAIFVKNQSVDFVKTHTWHLSLEKYANVKI